MPIRALARSLFHGPAAASTFAGVLGAGVVDALVTTSRAADASAVDVLLLAVALYGVAGIVAAVVVGAAVAVAVGAVPGGPRRLALDDDLDVRVAGGVLAVVAGAVALAVGEAAAFAGFVSKMNSRTLATIAQGGLTLALVPIGALVALAALRPARAVAGWLPRPRATGRTGLLLAAMAVAGVLAAVAALSRADWRVLDLGWLTSVALALVLGGGHAVVWYGTAPGRRLAARVPAVPLGAVVVAAVAVAWVKAGRLPDASTAFAAATDHGFGLKMGLASARAFADGDGDGFSTRFGGGDCDDAREDTYPGADDAPGDGVDQNCEGGDAKAELTITPEAVPPAVPQKVERRTGEAWAGNILMISVDALRADRLGVAGYQKRGGKSLTPSLDALAKRGAYFRRAWSHAPNTPRSFPSLLTSRYPSEIAWEKRTANYSPILPANQTFFESLAGAGLRPYGVFSHFYFTADRGLGQGFVDWTNDGAGTIAESNKDVASPRIVPRVIARLEKAAASKERFVLWTHLFEPHSSYIEHREFPSNLRGVDGLEEKYDYEIAFVDRWIGKVLAALDRTGLAANTAVVVVADHGEAWGEHKHYFHGQDLTEEQLRVPLIIAVPGREPVVVDDPVALVDLGPTLVDLVGFAPSPTFRGRSLMPLVDGKSLPPRPLFSELLPATAWPKHEVMMVDGHFKVTHKITDRRWELHDLAKDPRQQRDLAADPKHKATLEALRAKVLAFEEGRR